MRLLYCYWSAGFSSNRRKMLPLNSNLNTIPLGVRREPKFSGIINYQGKKGFGGGCYSFNKYLLSLYKVPGADYPARNKRVLGSVSWSIWSLRSIFFFFSSEVSGISQSMYHVWIRSPALPVVLDFWALCKPRSICCSAIPTSYLFTSDLTTGQPHN